MSVVVHTVTVHRGPIRGRGLGPDVGGVVVRGLVPRHVDRVLDGRELVHLGQGAALLHDAPLLHGHGQLLLVAEVAILDDVGAAVRVVDNLALELLDVPHHGRLDGPGRVGAGRAGVEPRVVVVSVLQHVGGSRHNRRLHLRV